MTWRGASTGKQTMGIRSTDHLWTACRSVHMPSCALQITAVCPVCTLVSFHYSFPGALFRVHAHLQVRQVAHGSERPEYKQQRRWAFAGQDVITKYYTWLASKPTVWPGNQEQGRLSKCANWRSWLLKEKVSPSELLQNLWCLGLVAECECMQACARGNGGIKEAKG